MSDNKVELGDLKSSARFYFPHDPFKIVWKKSNDKRKSGANQVFFYCEDPQGNIEDFNANRSVIYLPGDQLPVFGEEAVIPPVTFPVKKSKPIMVPAPIINSKQYIKFHNMTHKEAPIKIFFTHDYAVFKMITGNRQLDDRKIKRIMTDIEGGFNVLKYCPVLVKEVNENLEIIDGQHRFYISRKLKQGVYYIIADDITLLEIARMNSNTEKWKDKDFINCYVVQGNEHYVALQSFMDKYGFPIGTSINMLSLGYVKTEGGGGGRMKQKFREGNFEVKALDKAEDLAGKIKLFEKFDGHTSGGFIEAISRVALAGKVQVKDIYEKYARDPQQLISCRNAKAYLTLLEIIFNKNNSTRRVIF